MLIDLASSRCHACGVLSRYRIIRGKRPPGEPLPSGHRMDVRKHVHHPLSPDPAMVERMLAKPGDPERAARFARDYNALLAARFAADRQPFEAIADEARAGDVYLGCSCPTRRQPDVSHCHTVLALKFFAARFPDLDVRIPE